jgi:hypothetical protein
MTLTQLKSLVSSTGSMILQPASPALQFGTLQWNDKAALAMTDFRNSPMISTHGQESIEATLQRMKMSGARFLFVLDEREQLVGSITSYDIQGERPLRFLNAVGNPPGTGAWRDVLVRDIMDPLSQWAVLEHVHVARLSIGDVARLMGLRYLRYLVVVEPSPDGDVHRVRGLFSAARIQQLLGEEAVVQGEAQAAAAEEAHALA